MDNKIFIELYDGPHDGGILRVKKDSSFIDYKGERYVRIESLNRRGYAIFIHKKSLDKMMQD